MLPIYNLPACLSIRLHIFTCLPDNLTACLSVCLYFSVFVYIYNDSTCLSICFLPAGLSICERIWLSACLPVCLLSCPHIYLSISVNVCLDVYPFFYMCICMSSIYIYLSICLSACHQSTNFKDHRPLEPQP